MTDPAALNSVTPLTGSPTPNRKVLRVGLQSEALHLDPLEAQDIDSAFVLRQIVESPFEPSGSDLRVEPGVFAGALESVEGTAETLAATVREDLRFSDGTPCSAEHVARCLRRAPNLAGIVQVQAAGRQVLFRLLRPEGRLDLLLAHSVCGIFERTLDGVKGTGPFRLAPDSSPGHVRLEPNPYYPKASSLDAIEFISFRPDAGGGMSSLRDAVSRGEIDICAALSKEDIEQIRSVRKSFRPGISTGLLYLNTESPKLGDPAVRRTLATALDRRALTAQCYSNPLAFEATSMLPRSMCGSCYDPLTYHPRRAAEAWSSLDDPPRRLTLLVVWAPRPYMPYPRKVVDELTRQLAGLGIELQPTYAVSSQHFFRTMVAGRHDLVLGGWMADTPDPADFLESVLSSQRIPDDHNLAVAANNARLRSAEVDRALHVYRAQRDEPSLQHVHQLVDDQRPVVPLFYGSTTAVWSFRVDGYEPSPLAISNLAELDIESDDDFLFSDRPTFGDQTV